MSTVTLLRNSIINSLKSDFSSTFYGNDTIAAMSPNILLPQFFLPPSAVGLGRFVISIDNPHHDFHDPPLNSTAESKEKVQTQYNGIHHFVKQHKAASQLTTFLSSSFSRRLKASIQVTTDQAKTYYLINAGEWFRNAVQSKETRKWIERTIDEGEDIYVVVAYHTLLDARIREHSGDQSAAGGSLAIPVSTALSASGVVVPLNAMDPGFSGIRGRTENEQTQFVAPGEQICAVQYRKVHWKWFASSKVDHMTLAKKAWWEKYDRPRYLETEIEDMIEVELEPDMELEGGHDVCAIESGEFCLNCIGYIDRPG
jgi:hypothetical protein